MAQIAPPPFPQSGPANSAKQTQTARAPLTSAQLQRRIAELPTLGVIAIAASVVALLFQFIQIDVFVGAIAWTSPVTVSVSVAFLDILVRLLGLLSSFEFQYDMYYLIVSLISLPAAMLQLASYISFAVIACTSQVKKPARYKLPVTLMIGSLGVTMIALLVKLIWSAGAVISYLGIASAIIGLIFGFITGIFPAVLIMGLLVLMLSRITRPPAKNSDAGFFMGIAFAIGTLLLFAPASVNLYHATGSPYGLIFAIGPLSNEFSRIAMWIVLACAARSASTLAMQQRMARPVRSEPPIFVE